MPKSVFTDAYASAVAVLIAARRIAGLSQFELAARLGKPQQFVSRVERRERRLDVVEFYVYARALGADPRELFSAVAATMPDEVAI